MADGGRRRTIDVMRIARRVLWDFWMSAVAWRRCTHSEATPRGVACGSPLLLPGQNYCGWLYICREFRAAVYHRCNYEGVI